MAGPLETIVRSPRENSFVRTGTRWGGYYDVNERYPYTVVSEYHRKQAAIRSNRIDPTPYSSEHGRMVADNPRAYREWQPGTGAHGYTTTYLSSLIPDIRGLGTPQGIYPTLDNAESKAVTMARERFKGRDSVSLGTTIAEARMTAEMLAGAGGKMARGLLAFRDYARSLPHGARQRALQFAGAWLEGYYGWGSLARDCFDLNDRLQADIATDLNVATSSTSKTSFKTGPMEWPHNLIAEADVEALARVGYRATIANSFAHEASKWGIINPLEVAWELVPYSFCIDWLVPVGNVLSSLTATAGLDFRSGYVSRKITSRWRFTTGNMWGGYEISNRGNCSVELTSFTRRLATSFELPRLYANENPFSTPRMTSAVALIAQACLGTPARFR